MRSFIQLLPLLLLLVIIQGDCSLDGCNKCTSSVVGSEFVQTCFACNTGFKLNSSATCDFDVGLVVGVGVGAALIIILQISCFCFCRTYFKAAHKKKTQYTLAQIFQVLQEERNVPQVKNELYQKYEEYFEQTRQCEYCKKYPEDKYLFDKKLLQRLQKIREEEEHGQIRSEQQMEQSQLPPNPTGVTVKLPCEKLHFYHLPCLKKQLMGKQKKKCLCQNEHITPLKLICVRCRLKQRILKLQLKDENIKEIKEYICAICFKKEKDKEEANRWWKKCC